MNEEELFYQIALSRVESIGSQLARRLIQTFGSAKAVFEASSSSVLGIEGISFERMKALSNFQDFGRVEEELDFIRKNNIQVKGFQDADYPFRLKFCVDAPYLLFAKGNIEWNPARTLSIVGTRRNTDYGRKHCQKIVEALPADCNIISGMAYGIDIIAHEAALKYKKATVAMVAHGLDRIYPSLHKNTLHKMLDNGGVVTEFLSRTLPDRENFPKRNRIIAAWSDATLVVESAAKGGSMITATIAASYNRDVFAVPGSIEQEQSEGCNALIHTQKATLIRGVEDICKVMNWQKEESTRPAQSQLFIELSVEEEKILGLIRNHKGVGIDELSILSSIKMSQCSLILLQLEMKGLIKMYPGKRYQSH